MPVKEIRSTDISLSDLPLDLLCLPLMLILLSWLSITEAVGALSGFVLGLMLFYAYKGKLAKVGISLAISLVQLLLFFVLSCLVESFAETLQRYLCLWREMLFMSSFLLTHLLLYILLRHRKFPCHPPSSCACERRRQEALRAEYVRFDRWLLCFCLLAIGICLVVSLLWQGGWLMEIALSHSLSLVAWLLLLMELMHLAWLRKRLLAEQWIPVLDEQNRSVGRVARSEVAGHAGTVPTVRLLAVSRGMLYLERVQRPDTTQQYDTPFEDWLSEIERPEDSAQRMIDARFCGIRRAIPRRLLPYRMTIEGQARLVYLMIVEIEEPDMLYIDCKPVEGKWWPLAELQALMARGACTASLLSEWETLEQTLFLAQRLRQV